MALLEGLKYNNWTLIQQLPKQIYHISNLAAVRRYDFEIFRAKQSLCTKRYLYNHDIIRNFKA